MLKPQHLEIAKLRNVSSSTGYKATTYFGAQTAPFKINSYRE